MVLQVVWVVFSAGMLVSSPLAASRTLQESPEIKRLITKTKKRTLIKALKTLQIQEKCPLRNLKTSEIGGIACRLAIYSYLQQKKKIKHPRHVDQRLHAIRISLKAAGDLSSYQPLNPRPDLAQQQYLGHRHASELIMKSYDELLEIARAKESKTQAHAALLIKDQGRVLFQAACETTRDTVFLANRARAPIQEQGNLQRVITSHRCFLDETKLNAVKAKSNARPQVNKDAAGDSPSAPEQALLAFAKTRSIDLKRCKKKFFRLGHMTNQKKMRACLCKQMKRWRFPKQKGRSLTTLRIPVIETKYWMNIEVSAIGHVTSCGALEGS
jgi:hypothetical protein